MKLGTEGYPPSLRQLVKFGKNEQNSKYPPAAFLDAVKACAQRLCPSSHILEFWNSRKFPTYVENNCSIRVDKRQPGQCSTVGGVDHLRVECVNGLGAGVVGDGRGCLHKLSER